jgi:Stress responsive A/B Barrel Domain
VIRHIVAFELTAHDEPQRSHDATQVIERLEALRDVVAGVIDLRVHRDVGLVAAHWPLVLVADFEDFDALEAYQTHPRHVAFIDWANAGVIAERAIVDFDVSGPPSTSPS